MSDEKRGEADVRYEHDMRAHKFASEGGSSMSGGLVRVIDFETTGTDLAAGAEVCEVGICDLSPDGAVAAPLSWLCRVESMPPEARAVHHITLEECQAGGVREFNDRQILPHSRPSSPIGVAALAAHNAAFEEQFLGDLGDLGVPLVCTLKAALRIWPDAPAHSNGVLRYWLEDQGKLQLKRELAEPMHRAGPDAYVTAHILKALFAEGVTLDMLVQWTGEPRLLPTCPIGKFRGKPWSEVESGFLGWMLRTADMDPDLQWNAQRELARRRGA